MDDHTLVKDAIQGDLDAFNRLVLAYQDMGYISPVDRIRYTNPVIVILPCTNFLCEATWIIQSH